MNDIRAASRRTTDRAEGDVNCTPARVQWDQRPVSEATRALLEDDAALFVHQALSTPCLDALARAQGSFIEDLEGRRLLDFHGNSVHQVGHGHPRVIEAVKRQLDELPFCPRRFTNRPAVELARRLVDLTAGRLARVLFTTSGAAAVSTALKIARMATGRHKFVSMWGSFHGATLDTISVGGEAIFRRGIGPLLPGVSHVPPPDPLRCVLGCAGSCGKVGSSGKQSMPCADLLEHALACEGDVAAVIAEPIRCTTVGVPPAGYWERVRAACDRHGALLIFDEIPVCLGRTGRWFAHEHFGVTPDVLAIGKGLGGGVFPMAGVLVRDGLVDGSESALGHYTHEKSPVGAAAALATIDVIREERLLERAESLGRWFVQQFEAMRTRHPLIKHVRSLGLLVGVELISPDGSRAETQAERVMYECLKRGLSFKVSGGNVLTLTPPLTLTDEEAARAVAIVDESLATVTRE